MGVPLKTQRIKNKIAYRFTSYVIVLSFMVTLLASALQLTMDYKHDLEQLKQYIDQIYASRAESLSHSLWTVNEEQLNSQLAGIQYSEAVQYVAVKDNENKIIIEKGAFLGDSPLSSSSFPLYYTSKIKKRELVGELFIIANVNYVYNRLWQKGRVVLLSNGASIFLVAIFILWIFHALVARHLNKIAEFAKRLDPEHLSMILTLDRYEGRDDKADELDHVVSAINSMRINLQRSFQGMVASEQDNRTLLTSSLVGLALWNLEGKFETINPAFANIIGRSVSETLNLNYWDILEKESVDDTCHLLKKLKSGAHYGPVETHYNHKDNYLIPVRLSALIIERNGEYYAWLNVEDITDQKRAAKELEQAKQKAEAANLAKSQFLANMSHELRTPMNAIIGYSEMLEEELVDDDQPHVLGDIKSIHAAAKHLLGLINDILDISKIEAGKMDIYIERFDLEKTIKNIITTIYPLIENKANTLDLVIDGELGEVQSDLTKVRQILLNLLSNASKFTEQGEIKLEVRRETSEEEEWIIFHVSDEGIGMTKEQQEKLFQAFTQADASTTRKYGGTGLGLAITHHFVHMLNGSIEVQSEFGNGSHFIVYLPASMEIRKAQTKPPTTLPESMATMPMEGGTVLVIDDDPSVRHLLKTYLSKVGYHVAVAESGKEGIELAKKLTPNAITLDVMMPAMDGWEVLSTLKANEELAHIPVIMLTMVEDKDIGYSLGASEYLIKPVSRDQLINLLRKYRNPSVKGSVLVVEDDETTRDMMSRMLLKAGWHVLIAENGVEGLKVLDQHHPDIILLDLMMPEMDGFEFVTHLRQNEEWANIPVVVLTAKDITMEDRVWLNNCVDSVFQKGAYSREELLTDVRQLLAAALSHPPATK